MQQSTRSKLTIKYYPCQQNSLFRDEFVKAVPRPFMTEMQKHPSFHGVVSKNDAELLLMHHSGDCYLTRYNATKCTHVLSVKVTREVDEDGPILQHFQLVTHSESGHSQYKVAGSEKYFDSISMLLDYYQRNPLNYIVAGIGDYIKQDPNLMLGRIRKCLNGENELAPDSPSEEQTSLVANKQTPGMPSSTEEQQHAVVENGISPSNGCGGKQTKPKTESDSKLKVSF